MNLFPALLPLPASPVIAFTGAGGKTSLIARLAQELSSPGRWVIVTTTTQVWPPAADQAQAVIVEPDAAGRRAALARVLARGEGGQVVVASGQTPEGKLSGVPSGEVESYRAGASAVLVEADGARGRGLKAPAEHEPVIPATTDRVVVVCSAAVVGQALGSQAVHRPERVAALTGLNLGDPVTPAAIATVVSHPRGGLRGVLPGTEAIVFVNQVEGEMLRDTATKIARLALERPGLLAVALGAAQSRPPVLEVHTRVAAVVLAAGGAHRFGQLKQVLPWQGSTLVRQVSLAACASQAQRVVVVVGNGAGQVRAALAGTQVEFIENPDWAAGQSTSVRAALAALPDGIQAALFLLADQPGVSVALIDALIQRYWETLAPIVVPIYDGQRGNPVLFDRSLFPELAAVSGDTGGRPVLLRHRDEAVQLDWPGPPPQDIDTPEDYQRLSQG